MPSSDIATQHFVRGQQLMTLADAGIENNPTNVTAMARAQALASVAQGHFHAAIAAMTMSTQRDLLGMAASDVKAAVEPPATADLSAAAPPTLERVRVDGGAYRVFDPNGVGTGSVTYDPNNGDHGYIEVDGALSQDFNADADERICHDVLELRGEDGLFDRLEYVYQRQRERAATVTRPYVAEGGNDRG